MAKKNKSVDVVPENEMVNVDTGEVVGTQHGIDGTHGDDPKPDAVVTHDEAHTTNGDGKPKGPPKDQSNRPKYYLVGVHPVTRAEILLVCFGTIGRVRKELGRVWGGYASVYENVRLVKTKDVRPQDLEQETDDE